METQEQTNKDIAEDNANPNPSPVVVPAAQGGNPIDEIVRVLNLVKNAAPTTDEGENKKRATFIAAQERALQRYNGEVGNMPEVALTGLANDTVTNMESCCPAVVSEKDKGAVYSCCGQMRAEARSIYAQKQAAPAQPQQPGQGIPEVGGGGLFDAISGLFSKKKDLAVVPPTAQALQGVMPAMPQPVNLAVGAADSRATEESAPQVAAADEIDAPSNTGALGAGESLLAMMDKGHQVSEEELAAMAARIKGLDDGDIGCEENEDGAKELKDLSGQLNEKADNLEGSEDASKEEVKSLIELAREMARNLMKASMALAEKIKSASADAPDDSPGQTVGSIFKMR